LSLVSINNKTCCIILLNELNICPKLVKLVTERLNISQRNCRVRYTKMALPLQPLTHSTPTPPLPHPFQLGYSWFTKVESDWITSAGNAARVFTMSSPKLRSCRRNSQIYCRGSWRLQETPKKWQKPQRKKRLTFVHLADACIHMSEVARLWSN